MSECKLKIGITQGDPNGIGWEVILKALSDPRTILSLHSDIDTYISTYKDTYYSELAMRRIEFK